MKVLVIQPKIGMGDMVIYLPYIHAISKKYQTPVSILVKDNSRAKHLLVDDKHIDEIIILDRSKNNKGSHDGLFGFLKLSKELKQRQFDKVFIFNSSLRFNMIVRLAGTNVELGKQMLSESGLNLISADDMNDGAIKAINSIGGKA